MVERRQDLPFYSPRRAPEDERELGDYVYHELRGMAEALRACRTVVIPKTSVAPAKPVEGQLVRVDGDGWDPGDGAGFYCYHDGRWHRWAVESGGEGQPDNNTLNEHEDKEVQGGPEDYNGDGAVE